MTTFIILDGTGRFLRYTMRGSVWCEEYPDAHVCDTLSCAWTHFKRACAAHPDAPLLLVQDYGLDSQEIVAHSFKQGG